MKTFFQVKWKKSDVKFEDRFDKYLDPSFFQHRVGELCVLRHSMCAPMNNTLMITVRYVEHCARAVDIKDLTNGDFRCELGVIR